MGKRKGRRPLTIAEFAADREHHHRFFDKVEVGELPPEWYQDGGPVTPCHVWTGAKDTKGYGHINIGGKKQLAHRVALAIAGFDLGATPRVGGGDGTLEVDHLCRVTACVNPEHLELVDRSVNWERGKAPSRINSEKTHCLRGHEFTPENTYLERGFLRKCRTCREKTAVEARNAYKLTEKSHRLTGEEVVELVRVMNWRKAAEQTGRPDNTLRKWVRPLVESEVRRLRLIYPGESAERLFVRSGLPKRLRTLFVRRAGDIE